MSIDFTSLVYPYVSEFLDDKADGEKHAEPSDESLKSSVVGAEHPLFSSNGLKDSMNLRRILSNSKEPLIQSAINFDVIKETIESSLKNKFPYDILIHVMDFEKKLDERSSGGANDIAKKLLEYSKELSSNLSRVPLNSEVLLAFSVDSPKKVKDVLERATKAPNEEAERLGSSFDSVIMSKSKFGEEKKRSNKEVYNFFKKRMLLGNNVITYL